MHENSKYKLSFTKSSNKMSPNFGLNVIQINIYYSTPSYIESTYTTHTNKLFQNFP